MPIIYSCEIVVRILSHRHLEPISKESPKMMPFVLRSHVAAAAPAQASVPESDLLYLLYLCFILFHCFSQFFMLNWIGIDWSPGSSGLPWSSSMASHTCFSTPWTKTSDTSYIVYIVYIVLPNLQHRRQPTITPSPAPGNPWHALGPEWHSTRHPARLLLWSHVEP